MEFDLNGLVRGNIKRLTPYSSARSETDGTGCVLLDANENSFGSPLGNELHRYPDPYQLEIKKRIAAMNDIDSSEIFIGNGSDEAIDLLFRIFCRPGFDNVIVCPPTYGMYEVSAEINDIEVRRANLSREFQLDTAAIQGRVSENTKLVFICSPNNPTGNCVDRNEILDIAKNFRGIVAVDEAYIQFSDHASLVSEIKTFPNLVVLQTFSKAWGLAGLRIGVAFAQREIIDYFDNVKPPYNISRAAQELLLSALTNNSKLHETVRQAIEQRDLLNIALSKFSFVKTVYPSEANFLLVRFENPVETRAFLLERNIIVRDRSRVELCEGCLRITVGTPKENNAMMAALNEYEKSIVY
jgi:histidinol-phosphate aminotransferase